MDFRGVAIDNPKVVEYTKNLYKQGKTIEQAAKIIGMPTEVIYEIYLQARKEKLQKES
jgi:transposase-like protein